jgi:hypothetical protein
LLAIFLFFFKTEKIPDNYLIITVLLYGSVQDINHDVRWVTKTLVMALSPTLSRKGGDGAGLRIWGGHGGGLHQWWSA